MKKNIFIEVKITLHNNINEFQDNYNKELIMKQLDSLIFHNNNLFNRAKEIKSSHLDPHRSK